MTYKDLLDVMVRLGAEPAPYTTVTFRGAIGGEPAYFSVSTPGMLDRDILLNSSPGSLDYDLLDLLTCPVADVPLLMASLPQGDNSKAYLFTKLGQARLEGTL
jgi:hypothetical protein